MQNQFRSVCEPCFSAAPQVSLQLHLSYRQLSSPYTSPETELRDLFSKLGGELGDHAIPRDEFVTALRNDDTLAAKIDLPTDMSESKALDQVQLLPLSPP